MISAADLTMMQTVASSVLVTSCTIQRNTQSSDGAGGFTDAWATLATVQCRVVPAKRYREVVAEDRLEAQSRWLVYLPAGQDVTPKDRIVALGITYEVVGVGLRSTEIQRVAEVVRLQ